VSELRARALPAAALALLATAGAGALGGLPGGLRFLVTLGVIVWVPGAVLCARWAPRPLSAARILPLSFFLGASAVSLVAWVGARLGLALGALAVLLQALAAAACLLALARPGRRGQGSGRSWRGALGLAAALAAVAAVQPFAPGPEEDAFDHIGYVRRIVHTGSLEPGDVTATALGELPAPLDPRKGTMHATMAVATRVAAVDPAVGWAWLPVLVYPLAFLAFVGFCAPFVRGARGRALAAALFFLTFGGLGYRFPESVAYGQSLAVSWLWVVVPLVLAGAGPTRRNAAVLAILAAGGVFVHAGVALHLAVLGATLILFARALAVEPRRATRAGVLLVAVSAAAGAWKALVATGSPNLIHAHAQGVLFVTERWLVMSPVELLRQHGLLFLGALALLPVAAAFARRDVHARRALAFGALPVIVCFVPWVATALFDAGSYIGFRALLNFPALPALVTVIALTVGRARAGGWQAKTAVATGLALWGLLFAAPTLRAVGTDLRSPRAERAEFRAAHADLLTFLDRLPDGAVVLSDTRTSYALSAFSDHRFVAVHGQHGNPFDADAMGRLQAVRDALSPYATSAAARSACARYGVDLVVVNGRMEARADAFLSYWDRRFYRATVARLDALPGSYRRMFAADSVTVYLHDPGGDPSLEGDGPASPYMFGPAAGRCEVAGPGGGFGLSSLAVTPAKVVPGESVRVELGYSRWDRVTFTLPVGLHVRFDHEDVAGVRGYPLDKYVRRSRERWGGRLLRLRLDHRPLGGALDPDLWPMGAEFREAVVFTVPPAAQHGVYRVEVTLRRESLLPNFTLSDLLFNRDAYAGTACAQLEVSPRRVR
jgi:hypothetical protein